MHCHLVTVKVCIERRTYERVQLDGFSFHQDRIKSLYPKTVKCRGTVQQHGVLTYDVLKGIPYFRQFMLDEPFCLLYRRGIAFLFKLVEYKWFEKLKRHALGKAALVHLEFRTDHNNGTA